MRRATAICLSILFAALIVTAGASSGSAKVSPRASDGPSAVSDAPPEQGSLNANVYVQSSAEYRACCYSIYAAAGSRLEDLLEDADPAPARPAVVMDLDETVLDNSSFQTFLYENDQDYTPELWARFEREGADEVRLVPGAGAFIGKAEALGVAVVYLSNRNERNRASTITALQIAGLDTTRLAERLYLKDDGASSDKSSRRDAVMARYNVLMLLGDNLRDFSELFAATDLPESATTRDYLNAIDVRAAAVDDASCHWGFDWFVLPNPIYGEWEGLMGPVPSDILHPSGMGAVK